MKIKSINKIAIVGILGSVFAVQSALSAPRTQQFTCATMKNTIDQRGSLIAKHRQRNIRFVRHGGYCDHGEVLVWRIVRAKDGRCYLKTCEQVTSRSSR